MKKILVAIFGTILFYAFSCAILLGASALGKVTMDTGAVWILAACFAAGELVLLLVFAFSGNKRQKETKTVKDSPAGSGEGT